MSAQLQDSWRLYPMHPSHLQQVLAIEREAYTHPWTEGIFNDCLRVGYSAWVVTNTLGEVQAYALMSMAVGEALTVPILKLSRRLSGSRLLDEALHAVVADESSHAQLGWWFLDWADDRLDDAARAHLGLVAGAAVRAFAPLLGAPACADSGLGVLGCDVYDPAFVEAARKRVAEPLAERGILVPADDLAAVGAG